MRLLYLHGLSSRPGGIKPTFLRGLGLEVLNPALPDDDFEASVRIAQECFDRDHPDAIVGSSRGGAVALALASGDVPLILIAPAWKKWGTPARAKPATTILHSAADAVIPISSSRELIALSGLPAHALRVVGVDHNMIDPAALEALVEAITEAGRTLGPRRGSPG